jgi:hypothetical protein
MKTYLKKIAVALPLIASWAWLIGLIKSGLIDKVLWVALFYCFQFFIFTKALICFYALILEFLEDGGDY